MDANGPLPPQGRLRGPFGSILSAVARPYKDLAECRVTPIDRGIHPLVAEGTVILDGIGHPAVPDPVPIMLSPGSEYRIRLVELMPDVDDDETHPRSVWVMERRAVGRDS